MSSEGSVSSNGSRIRQFGLYRSIDARTEEFLRLSRRRQIRQGCACAAVSTVITVTVVVVILLIYEYAIAVEWGLVQSSKSGYKTSDVRNITHDTPFADRLDRNFFGFDQDYYERMPLLVNALQESNYVDPAIEMSKPINSKPYGRNNTIIRTFPSDAHRQSKIRKSSPRPFIFEYRSATPLPFSKSYGSRSWVDSYRNAQRLQNIRQVIRYLEKTINAKAGDMHTKPTNTHTSIAFSGVYVEPKIEKEKPEESNGIEQLQQNSNKVETYANHNEDPLFNFKPDSPGEVNLLADTFFRFAPVPTPSLIQDTKPNNIPMFRRIPYRKYCKGSQCDHSFQERERLNSLKSSTELHTETPTSTKSFSVMLNLYPLKPNANSDFKRQDESKRPSLEKIFITTPKPLIQFRKKTTPMRQTYYRYKKPRYLSRNRNTNDIKSTVERNEHRTKNESNTSTMIVHVDVYSPEDRNGFNNKTFVEYTSSTTQPSTFLPHTEKPVELFAGQVEDYHDGSSGLITIPIPVITEPSTLPTISEVVSLLDTTSTEFTTWATSATSRPDVFKFSAEDAKVPDHYMTMGTTTTVPINFDGYSYNWATTPISMEMDEKFNLATSQMETTRKVFNRDTTQIIKTKLDETINWESTQTPMDRRSMNLITTKSVPMEPIHSNTDWMTTQVPVDTEETDMNTEDTKPPSNTKRGNMKWASTQAPTEMDKYGQLIEKPVNKVRDTLIIKLRNGLNTLERGYLTTTEEPGETTTLKTYVPQINGHYRSILAARNPSRYSPEAYRKRKLEMSVTGFRSFIPMYTEIKRNKTKTVDDSK